MKGDNIMLKVIKNRRSIRAYIYKEVEGEKMLEILKLTTQSLFSNDYFKYSLVSIGYSNEENKFIDKFDKIDLYSWYSYE